MSDTIKDLIKQLADTDNIDRVYSFDCTVDSVDEEDFTCDVTAIGSDATTKVPGVRIAAESNDGLTIIPVIGSTVTVILTDRGLAYISMFSDIEKVVFMDGSFGGMGKTKELTKKYNALEKDLNTLKTVFANWVVLANDGGAALKAAAAAWAVDNLTLTTQDEIENERIKHGE